MAAYKTVLKGHTVLGDEQFNVFYHDCSGTIGDALNALSSFASAIINLMLPLMNPEAGFTSADYYRWDGSSWHFESSEAIVANGTASGDPIPPQNAAVVVADTGVKKVRPKKFIGGLTGDDLFNGELSTAALVLLANFMAYWISSHTVGSSTIIPGTWRKVAAVFAPIVSALTDGRVGSQRKRKPGVGG